MKCKRCRNQVTDDVEVCPHCGQDLTALKQLLKSFYAEETLPPEGLEAVHDPGDDAPGKGKKEPVIGDLLKISPPEGFEPGEKDFSPGPLLTEEEPTIELREEVTGEETIPAGFGMRGLAFAIDHLILFLLIVIFATVGFLTVEMGPWTGHEIAFQKQVRIVLSALFPLAIVLFFAYFTFFHGAWGQTIGKMILGIRVVRHDGSPVSFGQALARSIGYFISGFPLFLGFLWAVFSSSKSTWHDLLAGTRAIRE